MLNLILSAILSVLLSLPLAAADLTKDDVVKLVKAGLKDDVVVAQIEASGIKFALSTDDILKLKQEGVSDNIITAMIKSGPKPSTANPAPTATSSTAAPAPAASLAGDWEGKVTDSEGGGKLSFTLYGSPPHQVGNAMLEATSIQAPGRIALNSYLGGKVKGNLIWTLKAGSKICKGTLEIEGDLKDGVLSGTTLERNSCAAKTLAGSIEMKRRDK